LSDLEYRGKMMEYNGLTAEPLDPVWQRIVYPGQEGAQRLQKTRQIEGAFDASHIAERASHLPDVYTQIVADEFHGHIKEVDAEYQLERLGLELLYGCGADLGSDDRAYSQDEGRG
jgi:hypothetical protein